MASSGEPVRYSMPVVRLIPTDIDEVRGLLEAFPADAEIELETGVPLKAKTVGDVRALSTWPPGLRLVYDREHGFMRVRIERV
jgi:hypothetical protein